MLAITSATSPFNNSLCFQFLINYTGFPNIQKGSLNDIGFVLLTGGNSTGSALGYVFWISLVGILTAVLMGVLWALPKEVPSYVIESSCSNKTELVPS
jgi:hypothetical protein